MPEWIEVVHDVPLQHPDAVADVVRRFSRGTVENRDGDRLIVVASKSGAPDHPAWFHHLKANSLAKVEIGTDTCIATLDVKAHEAEGEERERIWSDRVAMAPGFGEYQKQTSRRIPVMLLEPIGQG